MYPILALTIFHINICAVTMFLSYVIKYIPGNTQIILLIFLFLCSGCRNSLVNMEVRPMDAKMLTRRCVVAQLREVTMPKFRDLLTQNAGALLVLLPEVLSDLTEEEKKVC